MVSVLKTLSLGVDMEKWQTPGKVRPSRKLYIMGRVSTKGIVGLWTFCLSLFSFLGVR